MMMRTGVVMLCAASLALGCTTVYGAEHFKIPEESDYAPMYARLPLDPATMLPCGDWAWVPIIFYRAPECVPEDFNLHLGFDAPGAWSCPFLMEGHMVLELPPDVPQVPRLINVKQVDPVPVYFVSAQDPADQPLGSRFMLITMGDGISIKKLLQCSLEASARLLATDPAPDQVPQ